MSSQAVMMLIEAEGKIADAVESLGAYNCKGALARLEEAEARLRSARDAIAAMPTATQGDG